MHPMAVDSEVWEQEREDFPEEKQGLIKVRE